MYLGIDLGTTNSSIAGNINSEIQIFETKENSKVFPSVIYIDKRGHRLYGKRAYDQALLSPNNVAAGFKRLMGTSTMIEFAASGQAMTPEECSADIIRQLLGQAFIESGEMEVAAATITIPAAFNQMQSEATLRATKSAKLDNVALLQEPIAASMAAMEHTKNKSGQFMVYDLGGGTFDLALVQSNAGSVNIIAHEGIAMLGGKDFDRLIVNNIIRLWLLENFDLPVNFQKDPKYQRIIRIAMLAAEKAKIDLSMKESETIFASDDELRVTDESGADIYLDIELARTTFEDLISDQIDRTIELSQKILKDNGYSHEDIDRIVFIGGPTKMPFIRNRIPQELGIPADLSIDPMIAVARGASIYCESRDWSGKTTTRKTSRLSIKAGDAIEFRYDFPTRIANDIAKIRVKVGDSLPESGYEIQIDTTTGWTSGRKAISGDMNLEVPVQQMGENAFRVTVFDPAGRPVSKASATFIITRTAASVAGIPATQTISVKVREGVENTKNVLHPLIEKGTLLPTSGSESLRVAKDLKAGENAHLEIELYQDEGVPEADLNLYIGVFQLSGSDLPDRAVIRLGDEVVFNWTMTASVELPSVGQSFPIPKFYVDQAGHQSYEGEEGSELASAVINDAEEELEETTEAIGNSDSGEVRELRKRINEQKNNLQHSADADTNRSVTEHARHLRQDIARMRMAPKNHGKVLKQRLAQLITDFNEYCRENADSIVTDRFDRIAGNAKEALDKNNTRSIKEVEIYLEEMGRIYLQQLWQNPSYIISLFKEISRERYLASDKDKFDALIKEGIQALEQHDIDGVRRIIFKISDDQVIVGTVDKKLAKLSDIMRA